MDPFAKALDFTLNWEGRIVENVPDDPGGLTKWGITQRDYDLYRSMYGAISTSVADATPDEIRLIYFIRYWKAMDCDKLPYPVALAIFDCAVNVGVSQTAKFLTAILGIPLGSDWLQAAKIYSEKHSPETLAAMLNKRRSQFYKSLAVSRPVLRKFLPGWLNRVVAVNDAVFDVSTA